MTTLMIDGAVRPEVRTPVRPLGPAGASRPVVRWTHVTARACQAGAVAAHEPTPRPRVAPAAATPTRLVWTPRGIAVMVLAVVMTAVFMLVTIVNAFLAVSNAPAPSSAMSPPAVVALAEAGPADGGQA